MGERLSPTVPDCTGWIRPDEPSPIPVQDPPSDDHPRSPRLVQFRTAHTSSSPLTYVAMTDRAQLMRLVLCLERDVLAQAQLRTLLAAADVAIAGHRQEVRNLKARMARRSPKSERNQ